MYIGIAFLVIGIVIFSISISTLKQEFEETDQDKKKILIISELLEVVFFQSISRLFWIMVSFFITIIGLIILVRQIV